MAARACVLDLRLMNTAPDAATMAVSASRAAYTSSTEGIRCITVGERKSVKGLTVLPEERRIQQLALRHDTSAFGEDSTEIQNIEEADQMCPHPRLHRSIGLNT